MVHIGAVEYEWYSGITTISCTIPWISITAIDYMNLPRWAGRAFLKKLKTFEEGAMSSR
jgi:hypothetical protein